MANEKKRTDAKENLKKARLHLDNALKLLRDAREAVNRPQLYGARELSEAITCLETGSMWMNRSEYADKPYSPFAGRQEDEA